MHLPSRRGDHPPLANAPSEITVRRPGEKPWVGVTLEWLRRCGVEFTNENFELYRIRGNNHWRGFDVEIPRDWSAALYPIVAGLVCPASVVTVPGMDTDDSQGDKAVLDVLRAAGRLARQRWQDSRRRRLEGFYNPWRRSSGGQ